MSGLQALSQVHLLVSQICEKLEVSTTRGVDEFVPVSATPLSLSRVTFNESIEDLSRFGLAHEVAQALVHLYEEKLIILGRSYREEYIKVITTLSRSDNCHAAFHQDFRGLLERGFALQARKIWETVLKEVEKSVSSGADASRATGHTQHESHEPQTSNRLNPPRGHHAEAVQILEQAFVHTPNITQAEKYRLAEVTGLQPKQVTIWFQNRRNRKSKKTLHAEPTPTPSTGLSPSERHSPPPASPTRDFTLSEKKRKSYGALGRSPADYTDSEADSSSSSPKKPRLPSCESESSDTSVSSSEYPNAFIPWSSPSSRSTSSSSASSGASDYSDSPAKSHNVFKYISPLRYDVKAKAAMPGLTLATQQLSVQPGLAQGQRSPFTSDYQNNVDFKSESMDFGGLQLPDMLHDTELMRSVQEALAMHSADFCSSQSVSSSSWSSQQVTTDDDGWFDEDECAAPLAGRHVTTVDGPVASQTSAAHPSFQSIHAADSHGPSTIVGSQANNASPDGGFSYPASSEDESYGLFQLFNSAASTHIPSSSPLPPPPTGDAAVDTPNFNVDIEMDDIQQFLDTDIFASSLPSSQQSTQIIGHGAGCAEMQRTDGMQGGHPAEAQFFMNFDLSSQAFMPI